PPSWRESIRADLEIGVPAKYKKRDAWRCVPGRETLKDAETASVPEYRLLLEVLNQRAVLRDLDRRILAFVLERDLVDHAAVVVVPLDVRDFSIGRLGLDGRLHLLGQRAQF